MRIFKILFLVLPVAVLAQPLPMAKRPEEVGISSERVERVRQVMKHPVESNRVAGGVLLIARNGRAAVLESFGYQQRSSSAVMKTDCIFRIASMSKPITSVATMILAAQANSTSARPLPIPARV
jgi:CubicO group peptidase (beta-lactamase class C family)